MIIRKNTPKEPNPQNVRFHQYKFNNKTRPDPSNVIIICCFSEFGCETLGSLYCIPKFKEWSANSYFIVAGWYGREYLYRHLVDEYWELDEEFQYLRESARAFHYESKSLERIENNLAKFGTVVPSCELGKIIIGNVCQNCKKIYNGKKDSKCDFCGQNSVGKSLFDDVELAKKNMIPIPPPSEEKMLLAEKYIGKNPVGIFARGRKCYGRNLTPEFYTDLIYLLESKGYTSIWLGEKQSTIPCPVSHIVDFSRNVESRDLELTCAIISKLKFTIQFWNASTRLSAMVGTPYILFESPDQIVGMANSNSGQEGLRIKLTSFNKYKIVYSDFLNTLENPSGAIKVVDRVVTNIENDNWDIEIGLVEEESVVKAAIDRNQNKC